MVTKMACGRASWEACLLSVFSGLPSWLAGHVWHWHARHQFLPVIACELAHCHVSLSKCSLARKGSRSDLSCDRCT